MHSCICSATKVRLKSCNIPNIVAESAALVDSILTLHPNTVTTMIFARTAGNVVVFKRPHEISRGLCGDWYGYVEPTVLPHLVATHILGSSATDSALSGPLASLWRGCMGLSLAEIEDKRRKHGVAQEV
jgi:hypothetical protein